MMSKRTITAKDRAIRVIAKVLERRFDGPVLEDEQYPDLSHAEAEEIAETILKKLAASRLRFVYRDKASISGMADDK